jgi:hypothetical protein
MVRFYWLFNDSEIFLIKADVMPLVERVTKNTHFTEAVSPKRMCFLNEHRNLIKRLLTSLRGRIMVRPFNLDNQEGLR